MTTEDSLSLPDMVIEGSGFGNPAGMRSRQDEPFFITIGARWKYSNVRS